MARVLSHVERDLWDTIQKRAAQLTPAMQRSIEKSFDLLRDSLSMGEIERLVKSGGAEAFIGSIFDDASLNRTFSPARAELINSVGKSANGFIQDLPGGGAAAAGVFDILDPRVSEAIRTLDTTVMRGLRDQVRETARQAFTSGIESGKGAAYIARRVRDTIGLAPNQLQQVDNFRAALEAGDISKALSYTLRDKRFDGTIRKMTETPLTASQVNTMTASYHAKRLASNARTFAYTAVNDSQKLGKHLATEAGIAAGALPEDNMFSRWSASNDGKVRPLHQQMDGYVVKFGDPFPTGDVIPGASEWGCRCIKVDFIGREGTKVGPAEGKEEPNLGAPAETPAEPFPQGPAEYPPLNPDADNTMDRFRAADGTWTPERQALHDEIVAKHFEGLTPADGRPEIMVTGGGPASGKGSVLKGIDAPNHVHIDPDLIKAELPEYQQGVKLGRTDAAAFAHEESSYLRDRLAAEAVSRNFNAVIDGTGDNGLEKLAGKIASYRAGGARIVANYVTLDTDVAMQRMLARGRRSGRYVPEKYLRDVHADIRAILPRAIEDGLFDEVTVWDNNGSKAVRMFHASGSTRTVSPAWERYLARRARTLGALGPRP